MSAALDRSRGKAGTLARTTPGTALTDLEARMLAALAAGSTTLEMAREWERSEDTVKTQLSVLYRKLGARNRPPRGVARIRAARLRVGPDGPVGGETTTGRVGAADRQRDGGVVMTHLTGDQHYRQAEEWLDLAHSWLDADEGWRGALSTEERISRRNSDLIAALVHSALSAASALAQTATRDPGGAP